jgi:hypothetical protein
MINGSIRIARVVLRLAVALSPPEKREWAQAMEAEMLHASDDNALPFAFGCLWAMARARAATGSAILSAARWALVLGAFTWSAVHIRLAGLLSGAGATTPSTLAYFASAAIALGAFLTAARGLRTAVILAVPVIALAVFVAIGADALLPRSPFVHFYRAIAIEYVVILLVATLIATGVPRWVDRRERHFL